MGLQSEFYKDLSTVEKTVFRVTKKKFKAGVLLGLTCVIIVVMAFIVPEWAIYPTTIGIGALLAPYPVLLLLGKWPEYRRKLLLHVIQEERVYQTNQIRRYDSHEFIQEKTISERDSI